MFISLQVYRQLIEAFVFLYLDSIHVRRTDKDSEAFYHPLISYKNLAEKFLNLSSLNGMPKSVYVASDVASISNEFKQKYNYLPMCLYILYKYMVWLHDYICLQPRFGCINTQ